MYSRMLHVTSMLHAKADWGLYRYVAEEEETYLSYGQKNEGLVFILARRTLRGTTITAGGLGTNRSAPILTQSARNGLVNLL